MFFRDCVLRLLNYDEASLALPDKRRGTRKKEMCNKIFKKKFCRNNSTLIFALPIKTGQF